MFYHPTSTVLFLSFLSIYILFLTYCTGLNIQQHVKEEWLRVDIYASSSVLGGKGLSFSPLLVKRVVGFFNRYSLLDKEILLYFKFSKSFHMNGNWILSKKIFAYIDMIVWYVFFSLLICWVALSNFSVFNQSCILGVNTTWSWFIISLICCQIIFFHIFLKNFGLYSWKILISSFLFGVFVFVFFFWCLDIIFVSFW